MYFDIVAFTFPVKIIVVLNIRVQYIVISLFHQFHFIIETSFALEVMTWFQSFFTNLTLEVTKILA